MPRGLKRFQTAHFELSDWLGTRRVLTDYAGNVQESCDSLPYGNGETCTPAPTEHLFTGKERDPETGGTNGNDYFGARYYANSAGRWLTPDPGWFKAVDLSNPQSWNLNSYVLNNPLRFIDPTGMDCTVTSPAGDTQNVSYGDPGAADEAACEKEGGVWGTPGLGSAGPLTLGKDGIYHRTVFSKPYNPGCSGSYQCEQGYNSMMQVSLPYQPQLQLAPNNSFWHNFSFKDLFKDVKNCIANVGLPAIADDINPFGTGASDAAESSAPAALDAASKAYYNAALAYAGSQGLTTPLRSSVYRGIMGNSATASAAADAVPLAIVDKGLLAGVIAEVKGCL